MSPSCSLSGQSKQIQTALGQPSNNEWVQVLAVGRESTLEAVYSKKKSKKTQENTGGWLIVSTTKILLKFQDLV